MQRVELVQRVDASLLGVHVEIEIHPLVAVGDLERHARLEVRRAIGAVVVVAIRRLRRRPQSLVSSTYATTYAPAWKPGRFRNQRSLTRARYGMPMLSSFPLSIDPMRGPTYLGRRWTLRCSSVTLSTSILLSSISVGMEPNQDSAVPGRSASATPAWRYAGIGHADCVARPGMCHAAASSASGRAPRVQDPTAARRARSQSAPLGHHAAGTPSGRASSAPPRRMPSARAPTRSRRRTTSGGASPSSAAAFPQASPSGPVKSVRPGPMQVERRDASGGPGSQTCAMRPPRSTCSSSPDVPVRAVRVGRARDVVLGDGPALGLVGVEQRRHRPSRAAPSRASSRGRSRRGSRCSCRCRRAA